MEQPSKVRLKYFLARQVENRQQIKDSVELPERAAAVLAALAWIEEANEYPLYQQQLGRLLGLVTTPKEGGSKGEGGISNQISWLSTRKLVEKYKLTAEQLKELEPKLRSKVVFYRLTDRGRERIAQFADKILGIPEEVEDQVQKDHGAAVFSSVIASYEKHVDPYLKTRYDTAKRVPEGERA